MDAIQKFLATLLDKFKVSNPIFFTLIVALLTGVQYFVQSGVIAIDPKITGWVLWFVGIFLNSSTFAFRNNSNG